MSTRYIEIEQTHSPIRRHYGQRQTLVGLGLNKIGRVAWVPDIAASRGMLKKVSHLVQINYDPAAPKPPPAPSVYDEAEDVALMRELMLDPNNITLEPYDDDAKNKGKTPDFKLFKDGKLCGFCKLKSPRDEFILETPEPGGVAIRKDVPFYRKLARQICNAVAQLDAENPDHTLPNILVFVSHTPEIERRDLIATIAGIPVPGGDPLFMLCRKMQKQVVDAARRIDLFLWINAKVRTCQHLTANGAAHKAAALNLVGLVE